jgi:hypothetical protein
LQTRAWCSWDPAAVIVETEPSRDRGVYLNTIQIIHPKVAHIARLRLRAKIQGFGEEYFRPG